MKNLILIATFVLGSILKLSANYGPEKSTISVLINEKSVVLNLNDIVAEADRFTIINETGGIVFTESVGKYESRVIYSLENFPQGNYTIMVEGTDLVESFETVITKEVIKLEGTEAHVKPVVETTEGKVTVNGFFGSEQKVHFDVYNEEGALVYSYYEKCLGDFGKIFNLQQLRKGNYKVVVATEHFTESMEMTI